MLWEAGDREKESSAWEVAGKATHLDVEISDLQQI